MLNREAESLKKMVVTVHSRSYHRTKWDRELIQDWLDELREVKSGVLLVAGQFMNWHLPDEEIGGCLWST